VKKLLGLAGLAGAALLGRRYLSARPAMAEVAPDLRSPILPLLMTAPRLSIGRMLFRIKTSPGPGVELAERRTPVPAYVFTPSTTASGRRPGVLWIHGGGMVMGSPRLEAAGSGGLARDLDAVVVSPDYRLAPENPFPAALDDCMATLTWMRQHADKLGIDPDRIAVVGSSAGGGLSAAVAQRAHDEGITLRAQILVYPMIDDRTAIREKHEGRGTFLWTPEANLFGWTAYLGRPPRLSDAPEYAAPARRTDLSGLAPAWIGVGTLDLFYDESVAYAKALRASGVPCELITVPGMYHGADGIAGKAPSMVEFRRSSVKCLRGLL
jgi:acetyl esterase/lipase